MSERESNKESRKAGNLITQEWTPEWLANFGSAENWLEEICAAHKAALAAEREKADNLFKVSRKHCIENQQLKADQIKLVDEINEERKESAIQLAAERQRREQAEQLVKEQACVARNAVLDGMKSKEQLLSAQAAIEKIRASGGSSVISRSHFKNLEIVEAYIKDNGLSLLHQHDAEVRKALEQALSDIETSNDPLSTCSKIRTALAKVKEGK